jgi:hypothetical protein
MRVQHALCVMVLCGTLNDIASNMADATLQNDNVHLCVRDIDCSLSRTFDFKILRLIIIARNEIVSSLSVVIIC